MPAEMLIFARDKLGSLDPDMNVRKGELIHVAPDGHVWGNKETLPDFVQVRVTDATEAEIKAYKMQWKRQIGFDVVATSNSPDGARLRLYAQNTRGSNGKGNLTRGEVEVFLERWNGVYVSHTTNEVVFDLTVLSALTSKGFFGSDVSLVNFTEVNYDSATNTHTIDADYSATTADPARVEDTFNSMGVTVVSHANSVIRYEATRTQARDAFMQDIRDVQEEIIGRCRFIFDPLAVDQVIANGGRMEITKNQAINNLIDVTTE